MRAGTPATTQPEDMEVVTTAPAATMEPGLIVTPESIRTPAPTHTFSPILTGSNVISLYLIGLVGSLQV